MGDPVGDFYVHLLKGEEPSREMTSSTKLLTQSGKPTVIHFYDGGWGGCRPCANQMERWARQMPYVQFLCVCVDTLGVAQMFQRMFDFKGALNAYIPGRGYMPRGYGQLGCSGFIIADSNGNFVSRKTLAYLQYREKAFLHVEGILADLVPNSSETVSTVTNDVKEAANTRGKKEDLQLHRIGISSMDDEHEACVEAFKVLMDERTETSLRRVLHELQNHFAHEEALMVQHGFGGDPTDPFSALTSHIKDHKRILAIAETELERMLQSTVNCQSNTNVWHQAVDAVRPTVATAIVKAFHEHADLFDALYANHIPSHAV